jgi:tetratricopeptide (TPR) repeat protein
MTVVFFRGRVVAGLAASLVAVMLATGATKVEPALMDPVAETLAGNYLAARFAGQQADLDAAARFFSEALQDDPDDPFLLERTLVLSLAAGNAAKAKVYAQRLQAIDRNNPLAALTIGVDALQRKRWTTAVQEFKRINAGPLVGLTAEVLSAWAEVGAGNPKRALARLDKLDGEQWYAFFRNYHGGLIAAFSGDSDEAIKRLAAARATDDNAVAVIEAHARTLARAGKMDEAKAALTGALDRVPDHPVLAVLLRDIETGRKPAAAIANVSAGAAEILSGIGSASARDDSNELGLTFLRLALTLNPKADMARISLAEAFQRSEQHERAIELLNGVSPKSPLKRNAEIMIGFEYNALDKVDEARAHLSSLIEADPSDLDAVTALGNVLRVRKMFNEAAEVYSKGIDTLKDPKSANWQLFYSRGITYERTDRWNEAEKDFKTALRLRPDQPLVLNYLGYSWVDRGMNYDEALAMIKKAVELEPMDGYIVDSLGWAYYKLGRYDDAVRELEKAVDLKPEDAVINDHLGDAYWKVGRKLEARFQWRHARDRDPEPEELANILKKLESGLVDPEGPASADAGKPDATAKP